MLNKNFYEINQKLNTALINLKLFKSRLDEFCVSQVWSDRLKELEKLHDDLARERDVDKVYKAGRIVENRNANDPRISLMNMETGEVLEDLEEIMDYYNTVL